MRFRGFRPFAIVMLFVLLMGGQLCMIVDCAPRANAASTRSASTHACCATAAARAPAPAHGAKSSARDCERPCCIAVAISPTPALERPSARGTHEALACVLTAYALAAAELPRNDVPPGDSASPPESPPRTAATSRAPPLA